MKYTGHYTRTENSYSLQGELDQSIKGLKEVITDIECDDLIENRKEILKGMINFLVEQL